MKNNLQTVAALLRLQARRTAIPEARRALAESVRRVNSIALVHESLSASVAERVDLDELVDKVLPAIGDGATADVARQGAPRRQLRHPAPPRWPRPLVLVLTELVHNALAHAFDPGTTGEVCVTARRSGGQPRRRGGRRRHRAAPRLRHRAVRRAWALQIVRTLLESELDSTLLCSASAGRGNGGRHQRSRCGGVNLSSVTAVRSPMRGP